LCKTLNGKIYGLKLWILVEYETKNYTITSH